MTAKKVAFMLAGAVMLIAATPSSAAERDPGAAGNPWYGGAAIDAYGSRHRNGAPQVPDCAYPLNYDSGGVAIFQRHGCRLP
jgi:hypothetical protein